MAGLPNSMEATGGEDVFSDQDGMGMVELTMGDFGQRLGIVCGRTSRVLAWLGVPDLTKLEADPSGDTPMFSPEQMRKLDPGISRLAREQMDCQQQ